MSDQHPWGCQCGLCDADGFTDGSHAGSPREVSDVTTYEEWRVTGDPGEGYPSYAFTYSPVRGDEDPEAKARGFLALVNTVHHDPWIDGPHLHKRTVTVTEWTEEDT